MKFKLLHSYLFRDHISQFDVLWPGDGGRAVIVNQFIERVEFYHPEEKFALGVPKHLEMLDTIPTSVAHNWTQNTEKRKD